MTRSVEEIREQLRNVEREIKFIRDPWIKADLGKRRRELKDELAAATKALRLEQLSVAIREQWAKYDRAVEEGMTGAPLAQIDRKLGRLEREREALEVA